MDKQDKERRYLAETLPAFSAELRQLLIDKAEPELATQVSTLNILDRCRCGDDVCCATFYTQPKPEGSFGPGHRNVVLAPDEGMVILDVVDDQIACVEVLDREDVREKLVSVLP